MNELGTQWTQWTQWSTYAAELRAPIEAMTARMTNATNTFDRLADSINRIYQDEYASRAREERERRERDERKQSLRECIGDTAYYFYFPNERPLYNIFHPTNYESVQNGWSSREERWTFMA